MLQSINIFSLLEEHVSLLFALEKRDLDPDEILSSPFLPLPHLSSSFSGKGAPRPFQIFQGFCKTRQPAENEIKPLKDLELSFTNTCSSKVEQFENSVINASSMTALSAILLQDLIQNYKILTQNQARLKYMRMMLMQRVHISPLVCTWPYITLLTFRGWV